MSAPKPATEATRAAAAAVRANLPLDQRDDFDRATRGKIAEHDSGPITIDGRRVVWDVHAHDFVRESEEAPDSVNPSLWRQARLNCEHGLFEVCERIWQVRGYDLSNVTFIAGDTGWIVIDPLTAAETARASLELANRELGERPVVAVIYTHSHVDHFGGIRGVVDDDDVESGRVRIIAPVGFLEEAVAENVIAGPAMIRRAMYMYGGLLPKGQHGQVDAGLGKATPLGSVGLIAPTEDITETGQTLTVDGVEIVFQYTPDAEAPAEMCFYFPQFRALCMAENCTHNMHNLYTPRGAQVRDSLSWSKYIGESLELFGAESDVMFASHHWPRWGTDEIRSFLEQQRDLYRWLHDQTMRRANHGLTPIEIAEEMEIQPELVTEFHVRGYYGTVNHNVKAVYQKYLGWFDGNPANLHPHTPETAAKKYVEYMGGADAVLERARADFDEGDYRWVATAVNHVVFADPTNSEARELQADALEQMGYQAESAPWRNFYLTGAMELRGDRIDMGKTNVGGFVSALSIEQIFDAFGVRLKPEVLEGVRLTINWRFPDLDEPDHVMGIAHRCLHHVAGRHDPDAAATLTMDKVVLTGIMAGEVDMAEAMGDGSIRVDGDANALLTFFGALDDFARWFPIVEP